MPSEANKEWVSSTCNYGEEFIASIRKGNVQAVQFHPEKSGDAGLSVLRRFLYPSKSYLGKNSTLPKAKALAKRIIACLDVRVNDKGDLVVAKGDQYDVREHSNGNEVRNLGKPVELAGQYYKDGTDEVSFLNITGFGNFLLDDLPMLKVLRYASENVFVPLTFGGGIRDFTDSIGRYYSSLEVAAEYFRSGADKISIGSDAVYEAENYIKTGVNGGREGRPIGAYELAKAVEELGAGEILLNCIDRDGQGKGYDIDLVKLISDAMTIPVISSSGAGDVQHFMDVFRRTSASAAFATGIFHRKEVPILAVKNHLFESGIDVRL